MVGYLVVKIGKDPRYWVETFQTRLEADRFIGDQMGHFPGKFNYILTQIKMEIRDNG